MRYLLDKNDQARVQLLIELALQFSVHCLTPVPGVLQNEKADQTHCHISEGVIA